VIRKIGLAAAIMALAAFIRVGHPARAAGHSSRARDLITRPIDDNRRVTLSGNTRREANRRNDHGRVPDDFRLEHMLLQLRRPPELQQEFDDYVDGLTRGQSANFHQWLAPTEVGENYGLSDFDLQQIELWLRWHGIRVNYVYPNRVVMDISGTARQLRKAFHVEIHYLDVNGQRHFANMNDPQIPEALAPAIVGIVSLHDFRPHPTIRPRVQPAYTDPSGNYEVTPADLAAIYNLNPLFSQGITGAGQTVVVVEDSDPYTPAGMTDTADWTTFEQEFQLTKYGGSASVTHPSIAGNCSDPGVNSADGEVELDMQYASAAAPGAAINVAACADTSAFGGLIAIENIVATTPHPYIISVSYAECEADNGMASNMAFNSAYQTAASEGISVFVASGDWGPAVCDASDATDTSASFGINVNGFASTPYNVAVGGTDFADTFDGTNTTYWSSTNSSTLQSAVGYIPEIPWNDSCASVLLASFYGGTTVPYGMNGFCNTNTNARTFIAASGGPSGCATGTATTGGEVSGSCAGYAKPAWQSGLFGNPNDGVRDLPDVSLFAANGIWGHFFLFCFTDPGNGGAPCTGAPDPNSGSWSGAGGTSFASPILAGIQALVNQRTAALTISPIPGQGNPNPVYYAIAKSEYGASGSSLCNSSAQPLPRRGVGTSCVFYDVTQGDIDVNCRRNSANCYDPGATFANGYNGALTTGGVAGLTVPPGEGGSNYSSAPACSLSPPLNLATYNGFTGGTQAFCTAMVSGGAVTAFTVTTPGSGYAPNPACTLTGGGGSGAVCRVTGITATAYQPSFPATAGWDFATGIGTINVYNLVFSTVWAEGP
jgi:subtilase family serine protease